MNVIEKELFNNQDIKYKEFTSRSIPNIDVNSIIGVRIPILRKIAKEINNKGDFLNILPHKYHEENIIHGALISMNKDLNEVLKELELFLPYVNNWAVCDTISPKIFKKNLDIVYPYIVNWINSDEEYKIRFGVVSLLQFYLNDSKYIKKINKLVLSIKKSTYYIDMAIAWYFSFAIVKQYNETIKVFERKEIKNEWIHNKSIQKAIESYKINEDKKTYLKSLRIERRKNAKS